MDKETKNAIIMEHYMNPIHRGIIKDKTYKKVNANSETCIDNIDIFILFEKDKIKDIYFDGEACAISTSATSIMIKLLIGKTIEEAKEIMQEYNRMIQAKEYNTSLLQEANCYNEIYMQENRIGCATIPWKGLEKALKEYEESR